MVERDLELQNFLLQLREELSRAQSSLEISIEENNLLEFSLTASRDVEENLLLELVVLRAHFYDQMALLSVSAMESQLCLRCRWR